MNRLRHIWKLEIEPRPFRLERGFAAQRPCRTLQRQLRIAVLAFRRWTARLGLSRRDAAGKLALAPRTLAYWEHDWKMHRLRLLGRGRPIRRSDRLTRNSVIDTIHGLGPAVGVPTLEHFFPLLARSELENLLARYRRAYQAKQHVLVHSLSWHRPGSVWAMDYTDPPTPIDRLYPHILAVRDLASGFQLLALPTPDQTAPTTQHALAALFRQYSPPLVLKCDNGSHFIAHTVRQLLEQAGVEPLFSPPITPQYNGACEAGIGSLKTRAHHLAARHGRPGEWTCDDIEAARLLANATGRPRGHQAPTPNVAWRHRPYLSPSDRRAFRQTLAQFHAEALAEHHANQQLLRCVPRNQPDPATQHGEGLRPARAGPNPSSHGSTDPNQQAHVGRVAIRRALVAHGLLSFTGRRITPPIKPRKVARIT